MPRPAAPSLATVRAAVTERLFGGRAWIVVLGSMLLGLVFLQVSLLQLNTQISTDIGRAAQLERGNSEVRSGISHLTAGRRVQDVARTLGMILPGAGAMCYLSAGRSHPCDGGGQSGSTAQAADSGVVRATPPPGSAAAAAQPVATAQAPATQQPTPAGQPMTATAPATQAPVAQQTPAPAGQPVTTATQTPPPAAAPAQAPVATGGQAAPQG
jgi:cell division protein FtsL